LKRTRWEGAHALTLGKHTIEFDFKYDGLGMGTLAFNNVSGIGRGGTGVLKVDDNEVARQTLERTIPLSMQRDENFDIGADTGTPVDDKDYQVPFRCTGKLDKLALRIDRPKLTRRRKAAEGGGRERARQAVVVTIGRLHLAIQPGWTSSAARDERCYLPHLLKPSRMPPLGRSREDCSSVSPLRSIERRAR